MHEYKITLATELKLSATDFSDSWNSTAQCQGIAAASTEAVKQGDYNLGDMAAIVVLSSVSSVATLVLSELIKQSIAEWFKQRATNNSPAPKPEAIEVREISQPDGSKLIVVVLKSTAP